MTRHIILGAIALCFACATNSAMADNIGVGVNSTFDTQTSATAADNIGVGEPESSWYAVMLDWFESDDSE